MNSKTTWVSPARMVGGQDHLAVQAVSQHLFTELLPGLTNVTQRMRCYSFYPWFVWAFDQRAKKKSAGEIVKTFRRGEVLHALIGILHELQQDDKWSHGAGLVGRQVLLPAGRELMEGKSVRLSKYATTEDGGFRYFKHSLGALGQYYLGPLKELLILDGDARTGLRCTEEWGAALAEAHGAAVDAGAFFAAIEADWVDVDTVSGLLAFCPCRLTANRPEREALELLMFQSGEGELVQADGGNRRATLHALLQYVRDVHEVRAEKADYPSFLATAYTGSLPGGEPWRPAPPWLEVVEKWGV